MDFTPLKDFTDEDLRSTYCVGLNYTVKPGNERLAAKVAEWAAKGLVRQGTAGTGTAAEAKVTGRGTVTNPLDPNPDGNRGAAITRK